MLFRKIALLAVLGLLYETIAEEFAFKFKVDHEAILDCPDKGTDEIQFRWKLRKVNRTLKTMHGPINFLRDFDDSLVIRTKIQTWRNGGWKAGSGLDFRKDKACSSFVLVLGEVWTEVMAHAHGSPKCPVKTRNYTMNPIDAGVWDKLPLPGAPINKYKLEFYFETRGGTIVGCYSSIFKVLKK